MVDEYTASWAAPPRAAPPSKEIRFDRCSRSYLLYKRGAGMPLPYRCLTSDQRTLLDGLVAKRERALADSPTAADTLPGTVAGP